MLVFGESAGAGLVWIMSTMPNAPSLMKAAIAESGAGAPIQYNTTYFQQGQQYAQALGCNVTDVSLCSFLITRPAIDQFGWQISCFQSKSVPDLDNAQPSSSALALGPTGWRPFVDGKLIPVQPETVPSKVPFLAGTSEPRDLLACQHCANIQQMQMREQSSFSEST